MTDEIVTAMVPTDESATRYAYYAMLHFDDFELAKSKMNFVTEQVRKKTPVKFEEVTHRGVPIKYLEIKGFFKLFFKKCFPGLKNRITP